MISDRSIVVRIVVVVLVAVTGSIGVLALDRWQTGITARAARLDALRLSVQELSSLEWRAISQRTASPSVLAEWTSLERRLRDLGGLRPLEHASGLDPNTTKALATYLDALEREFSALGAGDVAGALELNEAQVDPSFDRLIGRLNADHIALARHGEQATYVRTFGTLALFSGAAIALTFLLLRQERSRRRVEALAAERRALERSRAFFELLLRNSADAVITLTAEGRVAYHSPNGQALLDPGGAALAGRSFADLLPPEDVARYRGFLKEIGESAGRMSTFEGEIVGAEGRKVTVEIIGTAVPEPTDGSRCVLNVREVTSRRRIEEELRQALKMEAVGRLAGGVAHDFNNLLTAMQGYAQLLEIELGDNPRHLRFVGEIQASANRAAGLTRQLLAYSRKQILSLQVLQPDLILRNMDSMLRRLIREDITLETKIAPDIGRLKADAGQLEQVIMNLALNARDAMPSGGRLTIEACNVTVDDATAWGGDDLPNGSYVVIMVGDTGAGMTEEVRAHIFEPFFTTKPTGQGTGLGLSTVYGIVKQSGGHVTVYSEPGAGTTFKVYMPRIDAAAAEPTPASRILARPAPDSGTILLVEDEPQVRTLLREALATVGYTILEAEDGRSGLELSRRHPGTIDLIVTDMIMPGLNGHELVEAIERERPGILPIYMSGHTESGILARGILKPGLRFLQKPFKPARLLTTVREALAERRAEAA